MRQILLLRHGQSAWQTGETRNLDAPLTLLGQSQADALAQYLARQSNLTTNGVRLATSSLTRAIETARIIRQAFALDPTLEERTDLSEAPFHIADEDGSQQGREPTPRYQEFFDHTVRSWQAMLERSMNDDVHDNTIIVTHNGYIKCLMRHLTNCPLLQLKVANCSISRIGIEQDETSIKFVGDKAHLPQKLVTF